MDAGLNITQNSIREKSENATAENLRFDYISESLV